MNLIELTLGKKAVISDMDAVSDIVRRRLIDLGIMEGCEVSLRRMLPLGGPVTIESGGQLIGIRRHEAAQIGVNTIC